MVKLTPKGLSVMVRHRRISSLRASGVGCVKPVSMPRPPAKEREKGAFVVSVCVGGGYMDDDGGGGGDGGGGHQEDEELVIIDRGSKRPKGRLSTEDL